MELKQTAEVREQLLSLVMIVAIFAMFFRVIYFPKRESSQQLRNQIMGLKMERDALQKFTEALSSKLQESGRQEPPKQLSTKLQILKGTLQSLSEETSDLLSHLISTPLLKGLVIREMSDVPPKKETGYLKSGFFINAEGTFKNVTKYLERIDALPVLLTIDNISMKALAPKANKVSVEMNGSLYALGG